jgi:ribosomal protein S18 acetylase RimI-like enzyme
MKVVIRRTTNEDLDAVYDLHQKCFQPSDCWYKSYLRNFMSSGYVLVSVENNKFIGVLLEGDVVACADGSVDTGMEQFIHDSEMGKYFVKDNKHKVVLHGMVMVCVHPRYRNKGLGGRLIDTFHKDNKNKELYLHTRQSNANNISVYKSKGYQILGRIKDKYFQPTEDSVFMYRNA